MSTPHDMPYDYPNAPAELLDSLGRYRDERIPTGGFLKAVLANDLQRAAQTMHRGLGADALRDLCWYVTMELPSLAHGSYEAVAAWLGERAASAIATPPGGHMPIGTEGRSEATGPTAHPITATTA